MQVVIIEDELPAGNRLTKMLRGLDDEIEVIKRLDSVEASVNFLQDTGGIDLIFMDIQLADGLSFDIFQQVKIKPPVIFTTAFDQYTLKAFKVNSIDYLLKPVDEEELRQAISKFRQLYHKKEFDFSTKIQQLMEQVNGAKHKERLLIKRGQQLSYLKTSSAAYCFAEGKLCYAIDFNGNKYLLETNLTQLEDQMDPAKFYRVNRHLMVNIEAVVKVITWLGGRLKIELNPQLNVDTVVSRERVNGFKEWLGR